MSTRLMARQLNWVSGTAPQVGSRLSAKVRYRQADQACRVIAISEDDLELSFERPQRAVTPGQSVVLYDGEECLGGGIIEWADAPPAAQPASLRKVAT
jgi:tRNA-specific 2-thiouridylase